MERVLHLLQPLGVRPYAERLIATIQHAEDQRVADFLEKNGIDPAQLIGFHVSSRRPANRWPLERFADLAYRLIQDKRCVVLTWGPGDQALAEEIRTRTGPGVFLFPTPTFKHLGALQVRCRLFVSPDGGAMHFSTAVGTPTIGLFGETDPREWGPWGDGHVGLRRGHNAAAITVEEVYECIGRMLEKAREFHHGPGL